MTSRSCRRISRRVADARDSCDVARPRRTSHRAVSSTPRTGRVRSRASAIRRRGCSSSGWLRRRTAAIAPVACSPAIARATGCIARCTAPASRTRRRRSGATTGCGSPARTSRAWCAARRPITSRRRASAIAACRTSPRSFARYRTSRRSSRSAASRGTACCAWCASSATRSRSRARPSVTARAYSSSRTRCRRLVSRQPAEHVHGPAHRAHARCGVRVSEARGGSRAVAPTTSRRSRRPCCRRARSVARRRGSFAR